MKRNLVAALLMCLLLAPACFAEQTIEDAAALAALQAAHPDYTVVSQDQWGDTAAAALAKDGANILCVAEKQNGAWRVTIDNPTALRQGDETPFIFMDTDTALFWSYHTESNLCEYSAVRTDGAWGAVRYRHLYTLASGEINEWMVQLSYASGGLTLQKHNYYEDENENILYETVEIPIPAGWMTAYLSLAEFDEARFPNDYNYTHDWTNEFVRQGAAEQLMPEYRYLGGVSNAETMEFLMQRPDGALVFVGVAWNETDGWLLSESTPLPDGTSYGHENFSTSLYLPSHMLVNMRRFADGAWGVYYLYPEETDGGEQTPLELGQIWLADEHSAPQVRLIGTHPWSDITVIDWLTLPETTEEALRLLDQSAWAAVKNPDPTDRLHLRTRPDKRASSLGKYYNGTPVTVLDASGDWAHVRVFGAEGYMMRQYLAFGEAMNDVGFVAPRMSLASADVTLYASTSTERPAAVLFGGSAADLCAIGVVGDEWFHVWCTGSGLSGYAKQSELSPGNG